MNAMTDRDALDTFRQVIARIAQRLREEEDKQQEKEE